jgi:uncharacterized protein YbgA (DUF1722 family)
MCGKIVANHERLPVEQVYQQYQENLGLIFQRAPKYTSVINTLLHAFGGVSQGLSREEKKFFLNSIEEYRDERIPLSSLLHLIQSYAIRFNNTYLLNQVLFNPYPRSLSELSDSGKGRNY